MPLDESFEVQLDRDSTIDVVLMTVERVKASSIRPKRTVVGLDQIQLGPIRRIDDRMNGIRWPLEPS